MPMALDSRIPLEQDLKVNQNGGCCQHFTNLNTKEKMSWDVGH